MESRIQGSRPRTQKKIRGPGQGQLFRGQALSRPRTGMLETKTKDYGRKRKYSPKKKRKKSSKFFLGDLQKNGVEKNFSAHLQNFNHSKRKCCPLATGRAIFKDLRLQGQGLDLRGQGQGLQNVSSRPRTSSRTPPLLET